MSDVSSRVAVLTEEQLQALLYEASTRAAQQVLASATPQRGLKVSEVAERLSCAESTVYAMVERGQLRAVRLGSAIRVLESALDDWMRTQAAQPPNSPSMRSAVARRSSGATWVALPLGAGHLG